MSVCVCVCVCVCVRVCVCVSVFERMHTRISPDEDKYKTEAHESSNVLCDMFRDVTSCVQLWCCDSSHAT